MICVGLLPVQVQSRYGGEEKSAPCVLTQGSFNSPWLLAGQLPRSALAGCRESECEKVSQVEENEGGRRKKKKKLQVLRQNTFFLLSLSVFSVAFKPNPQTTLIPRDKGESP